jgi:hypothetical protein
MGRSEGIADQVLEHPAQMDPVCEHGRELADLDNGVGLVEIALQTPQDGADEVIAAHPGGGQVAERRLAVVEHGFDQFPHPAGRREDLGQKALRRRVEVASGPMGEQLGEAGDGLQGGPKIVGHVRREGSQFPVVALQFVNPPLELVEAGKVTAEDVTVPHDDRRQRHRPPGPAVELE